MLAEARRLNACQLRQCPPSPRAQCAASPPLPALRQGKLYAGFLTLAPRCDACGLDYAFIDAGDGPAIFIIMIAGAIVVACALIVEVKYQPTFWLHAALWLPLIARHHAVAAARDEVASDRAAIPPQGSRRPG